MSSVFNRLQDGMIRLPSALLTGHLNGLTRWLIETQLLHTLILLIRSLTDPLPVGPSRANPQSVPGPRFIARRAYFYWSMQASIDLRSSPLVGESWRAPPDRPSGVSPVSQFSMTFCIWPKP